MTANPYRVLGPSIPPMLGRGSLVRQIERHLLKPTPDHVSVVGLRHYGKSVLLRHLAGAYCLGTNRLPGAATRQAGQARGHLSQ